MAKSENSEKLTREELLDILKETESKLLQATQNLGHPAYGHSTATTMGIDELRNELFDFLEVPDKVS
ncbi:hypothetical protein [uncultured Clostridium sp.]|uniref:hypothetical protein n=1 Tax=uncultured Clostridium sp. TaxID=59620 RepID=UPI002610954C|nr:hypothetical protein [uncultured Clostridium sp.]